MLLCTLAIAFSKYLDSSSGCWRENAFNCRHDKPEVSGQWKLQHRRLRERGRQHNL